jgi:hypothetical protein
MNKVDQLTKAILHFSDTYPIEAATLHDFLFDLLYILKDVTVSDNMLWIKCAKGNSHSIYNLLSSAFGSQFRFGLQEDIVVIMFG